MENRRLPTTCFEFTAKEVDELRKAVEHGIEDLYKALGFWAEDNPTLADEIDQRITLLEAIYETFEQAYFSTKEEQR